MWKFTNKYVPKKHMEKFSKFSRNTFQSSSRFSEDNYYQPLPVLLFPLQKAYLF